jgi:hypothetical protein
MELKSVYPNPIESNNLSILVHMKSKTAVLDYENVVHPSPDEVVHPSPDEVVHPSPDGVVYPRVAPPADGRKNDVWHENYKWHHMALDFSTD